MSVPDNIGVVLTGGDFQGLGVLRTLARKGIPITLLDSDHCISKYSRNRFVGEQIGKGKTLNQVLKEMTMVAEGVRTTKSAYQLSIRHKVEMPITEQIYKVLFEDKQPQQAIAELMTRDPKSEIWG